MHLTLKLAAFCYAFCCVRSNRETAHKCTRHSSLALDHFTESTARRAYYNSPQRIYQTIFTMSKCHSPAWIERPRGDGRKKKCPHECIMFAVHAYRICYFHRCLGVRSPWHFSKLVNAFIYSSREPTAGTLLHFQCSLLKCELLNRFTHIFHSTNVGDRCHRWEKGVRKPLLVDYYLNLFL